MGCRSDYLEPTGREKESARVLELWKEVTGRPYDHEHPVMPYGNLRTLDEDTARLCAWCKGHPDRLATMSLELQLWYQRHLKADQEREAREQAQRVRLRANQIAIMQATAREIGLTAEVVTLAQSDNVKWTLEDIERVRRIAQFLGCEREALS